MECVQSLETKINIEIVTRQRQQLEAEKERNTHGGKIECIESRVGRLKLNLRKGIIGMDQALQHYCKRQQQLKQGTGDNKENVTVNLMRNK